MGIVGLFTLGTFTLGIAFLSVMILLASLSAFAYSKAQNDLMLDNQD